MLSSNFRPYFEIARKHPKLARKKERLLIRLARKGDVESKKKIMLHFSGFILFRILTTIHGSSLVDKGEDIFQECFIYADFKLPRYKLWFKKEDGTFASYRFSTYLWKGITGIMMRHLRKQKN
ncbi:MAG: hypothetical protein A2487_12345 [Candidatus Raymondbacteria bacterium RifOxyC12_full_50_8]|uniref:RNA polymerase sigma-70 region 2 domain-containing protein n=1 Tax=Candidatus Raymondbacteria bacterium RIFOXYD12_FULL_49_13 TaxID=1817890 RepID=A0A1F7FBB2_UNCRA|nr:MAG: hypothetical protein A2248_02365 [Candidatus Raymondbacteria bacterium RIFOXYA2_FULL_49_16]OGJ99503.1 MAG: hypothetical protein A2487_12345 [Candidatus Raymondbacteria bacterium RifOxyC12_full_50_8]OGK03918.1 MAG: hypothetical protein A2519_19815 [Candidatus Raymondbacteria bacterium RIFOXYD12_FULL_49_13]OGP40231.1 MAG: hypothetical protein A2324_22775 [Candidatus Raymondbacteria bacterium RIFOXYB2_FULL_49_35]